MSNRYNKTQKILNNSQQYQDLFNIKKVTSIVQYSSFDFKNLKDISNSDVDNLIHIIQPYEKLFMISQKYYNTPDYGWLICRTNKISNELLLIPGFPLTIYFPLDRVLELL